MADASGNVGPEAEALPSTAHVGRVALRVGSLDRTLPFYEEVVGLTADRDGDRAELGPAPDEPLVVLVEESDAPERPRAVAGLFHLAVRAPDRPALGDAVTRLQSVEGAMTGASDHLVSEALYLRDPEGNGVEIYRDRPREDWPTTGTGQVDMQTLPLDLDDLAAAGSGEQADGLPPGTDIGHVHLEVTDLSAAERFYRAGLGLGVRARYGASATFLAAGGYHHHVGLNAWNHRTAPAGDHRGLAWWELVLPDADALNAATDRLAAAGHPLDTRANGADVEDPDGIDLRLVVRDG